MQSTNFLNVAYLYQKIYELFSGAFLPSQESILVIFYAILWLLKPVSILLSLLFLTGIVYTTIRMKVVMDEMMATLHPHHDSHEHGDEHAHSHEGGHEEVHKSKDVEHPLETGHHVNSRWQKILDHTNSTNPSDWRLAILECDIILDEMLTKMNYRGESLSDKLKAVEKSDFLSIDKAWEAHRVRNSIAHEGSNFLITDREAKRVIGLYEEVFKEFHYI